MQKWLAGILATIISGVVVYYLTNGMLNDSNLVTKSADQITEEQKIATSVAATITAKTMMSDFAIIATTPHPTSHTFDVAIDGTENKSVHTVVEVHTPEYKVTDQVPFLSAKFWLQDNEVPYNGSFLVLDIAHIGYANPVWINNVLIGTLSGQYGNKEWESAKRLLIPPLTMNAGENELIIRAGKGGNNYDDHYLRNIKIELNQFEWPSAEKAVMLEIDSEVHHLGDGSAETEGLFYTKFFELTQETTSDAILQVKTLDVNCLNTIFLNEYSLGYLPGIGDHHDDWTEYVQIYVLNEWLQNGMNKLVIEAKKCTSGGSFDDFKIRNIRLVYQ